MLSLILCLGKYNEFSRLEELWTINYHVSVSESLYYMIGHNVMRYFCNVSDEEDQDDDMIWQDRLSDTHADDVTVSSSCSIIAQYSV